MAVKNAIAKAWAITPSADGKRWSAWPAGDKPNLQSLLFPSNSSGSNNTDPIVAIKFANPHLNGLPIWGPSGQGVTVIRRYRPLQQTGYYAAFWYSDDSSFESGIGGSRGYWGFHPYPTSQSNAGTVHEWEIAIDQGDERTLVGGGTKTVVKDVWYTQALRIVRNSANSKTLTFWIDLPSDASSNKIAFTCTTANYGEADPPNDQPQITIGDSPWYATYQHERASGYHGEIKIIAKALSDSDVLAEAADMSTLVTTDAQSNIWWGKKGFSSVDDLTCDYSTGRSFVWIDASNKATLGDL